MEEKGRVEKKMAPVSANLYLHRAGDLLVFTLFTKRVLNIKLKKYLKWKSFLFNKKNNNTAHFS